MLTYVRMPPWRASAHELASFIGSYRSDEALATIDVQVRDGHLVMISTDRRGYAIALNSLVSQTFEADGIGLVRFNHDAKDRIADLTMSNPRVYSLRFHRTAGRAAAGRQPLRRCRSRKAR